MKRLFFIVTFLILYVSVYSQMTSNRHVKFRENRYYVSARYGLDTNSGQSESQPLATLGQALSLVENGDHIFLERGSHWREAFEGGNALDNITIEAYGSGSLPIIDGSDVVTSWSGTGGQPNVYEHNYLIASGINADAYPVYEDGVPLPLASSLANCNSTAGTYFWVENSSTDITVYIHPTGSGDPTSNGKIYEVTKRTVLHLGDNASVDNIHTKRSLDRAGSMISYWNSERNFQIAENGTSHNEFNSGGKIYNMLALESVKPAAGTTFFVSYDADPTDTTALYLNCYAINTQQPDAVHTSGTGYSAFYTHGTGGTEHFRRVDILDSGAYRVRSCANVEADSLIVRNGSWQKVASFGFNSSNNAVSGYQLIEGNQVWIESTGTQGFLPANGRFYNNAVFLDDATASNAFRHGSGDDIILENNVFYTEDRCVIRKDIAGSGTTVSNYNVFYGRPNTLTHIQVDNGSYTGDYNIYFAQNFGGSNQVQLREGGTTHTTLAAFIAATGQDENSVFLTPYQATKFWAGDPTKGDFRIRPDAEVSYVDPVDATYNNGNDIIRTLVGEFPDGTKLTEAGVRPGFPTKWRDLPLSSEEFYKITQ